MKPVPILTVAAIAVFGVGVITLLAPGRAVADTTLSFSDLDGVKGMVNCELAYPVANIGIERDPMNAGALSDLPRVMETRLRIGSC